MWLWPPPPPTSSELPDLFCYYIFHMHYLLEKKNWWLQCSWFILICWYLWLKPRSDILIINPHHHHHSSIPMTFKGAVQLKTRVSLNAVQAGMCLVSDVSFFICSYSQQFSSVQTACLNNHTLISIKSFGSVRPFLFSSLVNKCI